MRFAKIPEVKKVIKNFLEPIFFSRIIPKKSRATKLKSKWVMLP